MTRGPAAAGCVPYGKERPTVADRRYVTLNRIDAGPHTPREVCDTLKVLRHYPTNVTALLRRGRVRVEAALDTFRVLDAEASAMDAELRAYRDALQVLQLVAYDAHAPSAVYRCVACGARWATWQDACPACGTTFGDGGAEEKHDG